MKTALLLRYEGGTSSDTVSREESRPEEKDEEGLFCYKCGHFITSRKSAIKITEQHHHTFFNPAGVIYEIGCFSDAAGCIQYGPFSSEFSWFAGYMWRLSLCAVCTTHLGWLFSSGDSSFYGLIIKNLSSSFAD